MKIKFIKPFRLYNPIGDDMMMDEGTVENMEKEDYARWLIDNGFAEEVEESGWWKPNIGEEYYFIDDSGIVTYRIWVDDNSDENRFRIGNCFKTREATKKWRDYLKAIATVRQDEGVIDLQRAFDRRESVSSDDFSIYTIAYNFYPRQLVVVGSFDCMSANAIWFDTIDHADASLDKHHGEWETIANYDLSRE